MFRSAVFFFLLFLCAGTQAQQFGGNPPSVRWNQIETDTARIIFPRGFELKAQRIANIVHAMQQRHAGTIGDSIRKISIVIQDQTLNSNGYVGLGPYRSEFYTTAPQDAFSFGAVSWTDNLALHEFRHVEQYSNFNKGLSRAARVLLGEQGQLVANAAAVPDWFFEGDAVFNETRLGPQGRGAMPLFLSPYEALYFSGRHYSYMKLRNGSLRDYVPDHYALGYLLVAYGRKAFGADIWKKVTDDAVRFRPFFYPFQGALKRYTSVPFDGFVKDAMRYYGQRWDSVRSNGPVWATQPVKHDVVNYKYPYLAADGSIVVLKSSYRHVPAFYTIREDGREERITAKDISPDDYFSWNNGRIVYAASQPDVRWGNREFTSIRLYETATGEQTTVARHGRYFSPDISHDGKTVVAVEMDPLKGSQVVALDRDGRLVDSLPQSDIVFSYPKFSADDAHYYVAARNPAGQMSLVKYTLHDARPGEILLPLSNRVIGYLTVQRDTVLFTTSFEGRDELWGIADGAERHGPFRLAVFPTGVYQGVLTDRGTVVGSAFTADGYRLGRFQALWQRAEIKDDLHDLFIGDAYNVEDHRFLADLRQREFAVTPYRKSYHLLNIHSWRPYYDNPEYSFTLYGQNVLNTFQSEISYTYNENERSHKAGYRGIYGGSFLQPLFGISHTWNRSAPLTGDTVVHWNELAAYGGLQLPLNLSGGRQYRYLLLSSAYNYDKVSWTGLGRKLLADGDFHYLVNRIVFSGQTQQAVQQIYPHFAEVVSLQYRSMADNHTAHQWLATGSLYLPGLLTNHSLVLTGAYHSRDTANQYRFSDDFPFSRGYAGVDFPEMWKLGANYHFPLAWPDAGFGNLVYLLRIRANLFFDYTQGRSLRTGQTYPFRTAGAEVFFDTKWWNQQPVTFGIRYNRLLDNEFSGISHPDVWEFIMPVKLF